MSELAALHPTSNLSAGYSWLTNQYGLTLDNIIGYELVLPDGEITSVTEASQPDLFFSLKVRGIMAGVNLILIRTASGRV